MRDNGKNNDKALCERSAISTAVPAPGTPRSSIGSSLPEPQPLTPAQRRYALERPWDGSAAGPDIGLNEGEFGRVVDNAISCLEAQSPVSAASARRLLYGPLRLPFEAGLELIELMRQTSQASAALSPLDRTTLLAMWSTVQDECPDPD